MCLIHFCKKKMEQEKILFKAFLEQFNVEESKFLEKADTYPI